MAKLSTAKRWERCRADNEAGIKIPVLAEEYGFTPGAIRDRAMREKWQTPRRLAQIAKLAPPIPVKSLPSLVDHSGLEANPLLSSTNSPQFRQFLESLKSMEPAEFSRNLARIAQVKIVDGLTDWESINLTELKTWIEIQRKAADFDKDKTPNSLTLTVSAPRSLTRRKSPVIDVQENTDESEEI
jgi:hypothetical protein